MSIKILLVCLGNICRSPAAEGIVRDLCAAKGLDIATDSAGTARYHLGKSPYGPMQEAAKARGIDISDLRARQVCLDDFLRFDLIVAMDRENLSDIEDLRPSESMTPVVLFAPYADIGAEHDVPDPYYTRDFEGCMDILQSAAQGLIKELRTGGMFSAPD